VFGLSIDNMCKIYFLEYQYIRLVKDKHHTPTIHNVMPHHQPLTLIGQWDPTISSFYHKDFCEVVR